MTQALALLSWLGIAWGLWSGHFEAFLLAVGAGSCAAVLWLSVRMGIVDDETAPFGVVFRLFAYAPWLLVEIARANLHVARLIWTPSLPISPRLLRVPASQRSDLGNAVYANSITLTPGTVSLDVRENRILVHALTGKSAAGLETGALDRWACWVEGRRETPR